MIDPTTPDQPAVWRPIATCPRDGTVILLYEMWPGDDHPDIWTDCWSQEFGWWDCAPDSDPQYWLPLDALPPPPGEGDGGGDA